MSNLIQHLPSTDKNSQISENNNFIHTHVHSSYSLLDGCSSPTELANRAKELGMKALCLTDHNHLLGAIDFKASCESAGILPILGVELYYTDDTSILNLDAKERFKMALAKAEKNGVVIPKKSKKKDIESLIAPYQYPNKSFHILFLAKNKTGYLNLVKIQSEAARICTYDGRYHCDNEIIKKHKDGLIMTTACMGSRTARLIVNNKLDEAESLLLEWKAIFEDDFYLEIQPLINEKQFIVNAFYMEMSKKHDIKLVASNDVHYTLEDDVNDHDTILCIGMQKLKKQEDRMRYAPEFWLRSYDEMTNAFQSQFEIYNKGLSFNYLDMCIEALNNTHEIYQKCNTTYSLGADFSLFPKIVVPEKFTPETYLTRICYDELYKYKLKNPEIDLPTYEKRLAYELNVIIPKGFAPYMLVNQEIIEWCKSQLIPTGPGRGSAAGSLVLLLLNITKLVDPIKENLLFSRFLTKDRKALPD